MAAKIYFAGGRADCPAVSQCYETRKAILRDIQDKKLIYGSHAISVHVGGWKIWEGDSRNGVDLPKLRILNSCIDRMATDMSRPTPFYSNKPLSSDESR